MKRDGWSTYLDCCRILAKHRVNLRTLLGLKKDLQVRIDLITEDRFFARGRKLTDFFAANLSSVLDFDQISFA
jgi:hypothetical protein